MSIYLRFGIPMIAVSFAMFYLARTKKEKNYMIPGFVLLAAGVVNVIIGLAID